MNCNHLYKFELLVELQRKAIVRLSYNMELTLAIVLISHWISGLLIFIAKVAQR